MKLATFEKDGRVAIGAVTDSDTRIIDLKAAAGADAGSHFDTMLALIEGGDGALDLARRTHEKAGGAHAFALSDVKLLAPIPLPPQIRDASVFPIHITHAPAGMQKLAARLRGQPFPETKPGDNVPPVYARQPVFYITNRFSVVGPDETVRWPRYSHYMDFECELAVVIGRGGKDIAREKAAGHIFGYTIFNDFSARDTQLVEMQGMLGPAKGKSFDTGNVLGPWIVTADEIPDPKALKARVRINGETFLDSDTSAMLHDFNDMIAFISRDETLHPGEIIGSGTVGGGCGLEKDRYLEDGDVVELEIERIGVLRNRVIRQA